MSQTPMLLYLDGRRNRKPVWYLMDEKIRVDLVVRRLHNYVSSICGNVLGHRETYRVLQSAADSRKMEAKRLKVELQRKKQHDKVCQYLMRSGTDIPQFSPNNRHLHPEATEHTVCTLPESCAFLEEESEEDWPSHARELDAWWSEPDNGDPDLYAVSVFDDSQACFWNHEAWLKTRKPPPRTNHDQNDTTDDPKKQPRTKYDKKDTTTNLSTLKLPPSARDVARKEEKKVPSKLAPGDTTAWMEFTSSTWDEVVTAASSEVASLGEEYWEWSSLSSLEEEIGDEKGEGQEQDCKEEGGRIRYLI